MYEVKEFETKYNNNVNKLIISVLIEEFGFEDAKEELQNQDNTEYCINGNKLWVIVNDLDEIVGTIALKKLDEDNVELKKLYIHKEHRGKGLSKTLYNIFIEYCRNKRFKRIFLGTYDKLETAVEFYKKRRIFRSQKYILW